LYAKAWRDGFLKAYWLSDGFRKTDLRQERPKMAKKPSVAATPAVESPAQSGRRPVDLSEKTVAALPLGTEGQWVDSFTVQAA
jgi:hypothetical protein